MAKEEETSLVPRSKFIVFPVTEAGWATLLDAHAAGEVHRAAIQAALEAAGLEMWAIPGYPGAGPVDKVNGTAAGVYIGTKTSPIPDPPGTVRENFVSSNWILE